MWWKKKKKKKYFHHSLYTVPQANFFPLLSAPPDDLDRHGWSHREQPPRPQRVDGNTAKKATRTT